MESMGIMSLHQQEERARLLSEIEQAKVLRRYNILDTVPETAFDDISSLVASICECPVALVSILDVTNNRAFFKSRYGLSTAQMELPPREQAFCILACEQYDELFIVEDVMKHKTLSLNPWVTKENGFKFYAGAPLTVSTGHKLGTLCVMDYKPHYLTEAQRIAIVKLANQVVGQLELRLKVAELMETQEKLEETNTELTRLNKEKNAFLSMVSHDIRQPLGNIMLSCELIIEDNRNTLTSQQAQLVQAVHSSAVLMHTLVDDLLHVSKLDFGHVSVELDRRAVDVLHLVNTTVTMNTLLAAKKNISLVVSRSKNNVKEGGCAQTTVNSEDKNLPITCYIDPVKIEQTLNNLISNAVKFSYLGSTVEVSVEKKNDNAEIKIIDHGQGIPDRDLSLLFKPFQRLSVKPTAGEASTGLGLCIVKNIVEAHEGKIKIESKEGEGTTVIILLPLVTCTSTSSPIFDATPTSVIKETTKPLRILIAEDNTVNQKLLTQVLRRRHHKVQIASDGIEAMEMYTKEGGSVGFDVLLLDEEMPRMKGTEVAQMIRKREKDNKEPSKLPIISISGHLSSEEDQDPRLDGIDHCIPKPFQIEELIRIVERCARK